MHTSLLSKHYKIKALATDIKIIATLIDKIMHRCILSCFLTNYALES